MLGVWEHGDNFKTQSYPLWLRKKGRRKERMKWEKKGRKEKRMGGRGGGRKGRKFEKPFI